MKALLLALAAALCIQTGAKAQTMPSTEQFMNALGTCATSMNLQVKADMIGSIKSFYEGTAKTQGTMTLQNMPDFLKLFPESDRITAYKLYSDCALKVLK
jgi:hypothetical protein